MAKALAAAALILVALVLIGFAAFTFAEGGQSQSVSPPFVRSLRVLATQHTNSTVLANNAYLRFNVTANTQYWFSGQVFVDTAGAASGLEFALSVPDGGTVMTFCSQYITPTTADLFNSCTSSNATSVGTMTMGDTATHSVGLLGFINIGTAGGTVYVMFASGTNGYEADLQGQSVLLYYTPV